MQKDNLVHLKWPEAFDKQQFALLQEVIQNKDLYLVAQPIVNLENGQIEAVEMLSRADAFCLYPPNTMFELARKTGLLEELTLLTCEKLVEVAGAIKPYCKIGAFFNLESDLSPTAIEECIKILKSSNLPLTVEFTEYTSKENVYEYLQLTKEYRDFKIALDDFGRGAAKSLDEVGELQPDYIKVRKHDIAEYGPNAVRKKYGNSQKKKFILERIENKFELEGCLELGISYGQGKFFSMPVPVEDIPRDEWEKGFGDII
nr:EAL domain-containing protein [Bacillus sp. 165]